MCIFLYLSADAIFSNFDEKYVKKLNFKKKLRIKKFLAALVLFFAQKLLVIFFL